MKKILLAATVLAGMIGGYVVYELFLKSVQVDYDPQRYAGANTQLLADDKSWHWAIAEFGLPLPPPFIQVKPAEEMIEAFPATVTVLDHGESYVTHYTGQARRLEDKVGQLSLPFTVKVYDIASYVVEPKEGDKFELLDGLLQDGPVKVYVIRFLSNLPGRKIMNDIYTEINTTFTDVDVPRLKPSIDSFCTTFQNGSRKGDLVYLVWLPGGRIYSAFNTPEQVHLIGQDKPFAKAIWRIWAGEQFGEKRITLVSQYSRETK